MDLNKLYQIVTGLASLFAFVMLIIGFDGNSLQQRVLWGSFYVLSCGSLYALVIVGSKQDQDDDESSGSGDSVNLEEGNDRFSWRIHTIFAFFLVLGMGLAAAPYLAQNTPFVAENDLELENEWKKHPDSTSLILDTGVTVVGVEKLRVWFPELEQLEISGDRTAEKWISYLQPLQSPRLRSLTLVGKISDDRMGIPLERNLFADGDHLDHNLPVLEAIVIQGKRHGIVIVRGSDYDDHRFKSLLKSQSDKREIRSVHLWQTGISDVGLQSLQRLAPKCENLEIYLQPVGDGGFDTIAGMSSLKMLYLDDGVDETDAHVQKISKGLPNLERLMLSSPKVTNITPLAKLGKLTTLSLVGTGVSDITPLASLDKLTVLTLVGPSVTDITPLANLSELTVLDLACKGVTDIRPLANLGKLESLNLKGSTGVTEENKEEYKAAFKKKWDKELPKII